MDNTFFSSTGPRLALFAPPYERFVEIDTSWTPPSRPPRGLALVWRLIDGQEQRAEFSWLATRPYGLPLFVILPPPDEIQRALPLLSHVSSLWPRSVLPSGPLASPLQVRRLLQMPPRQVAQAITHYLTRRQLLINDRIRREVRKVFEYAPETPSISRLARRLYTSRRTLGRHFAAAGLPVPSHWLQFARLLFATFRLQEGENTLHRVAGRAGYPDGFTLSNQMKRLIDCRPTEVRGALGWEWVVERWIQVETMTGGIDGERYRDSVAIYVEGRGADRQEESSTDASAAPDGEAAENC
jgi:AraC-like DNA-binding protein